MKLIFTFCLVIATVSLSADSDLVNGDYKVPPLIVQPFAENAIHNGLLNKQKGERNLVIKASLADNFIRCKITDDGVGRTKAMRIKMMNKPEHVSYGIEITKERIRLHNRDENEDIVVFNDLRPDLVFLDIEMPVMNGFLMLQKLAFKNFELIFTTAYDHYAIKAIRFSALDYLVKPIEIEELKLAVHRAEKKIKQNAQPAVGTFVRKLKPQKK